MDEQILQYELDMGEPDEPDRPKPRRSVWISRQGLGLATAFALGVLIGAASLDKQHDASAARSQKNEVSLLAVFGGITQMNTEPPGYDVWIFNDGPLPVQLGAAALQAPGYQPVGIEAEQSTEPQTIAPDKWVLINPTAGEPLCDVRSTADEPTVAITVGTAADDWRTVEVPLLDRHREIDSVRSGECEALLHPERMLAAYAEHAVLNEDGTSTVTLRIDSWGRRPVEIVSIEPDNSLEFRQQTPLPITVEPRGSATVVIEVLALNCWAFSGAETHLTLTAQYGQSATSHEVWLDPYMTGITPPDECNR